MAPASSSNRGLEIASQRAWRPQTLPDGKYSQSLERGLAILRCFSKDRPLLGIADIADELGMSRSTTHRYAITLVALGCLEQDSSRKYRLGLGVTDLGMAAISAMDIRALARPYLEDLRSTTSFATSLAVLDGGEVCWLDTAPGIPRVVDPDAPLPQPGSRMPAHSTAEGKLLLAYLPEALRAELVSAMRLVRRGPNTITTKRELLEEMQRIRLGGLAVADEEQAAGVLAIAAPVRDAAKEAVVAIGITATASTIAPVSSSNTFGPHLLACADRLSARIGHRSQRGWRIADDSPAASAEKQPPRVATHAAPRVTPVVCLAGC